ncbi:arylsulfatase [Zalerion maritima]|uniref:Arylsulfatase n=1 Tax=Zalerion maritima TaxID=339359 RepID=A0AAD5WQQ0_9PEZI|nr:arylsulfatase [Zalerion maritima]
MAHKAPAFLHHVGISFSPTPLGTQSLTIPQLVKTPNVDAFAKSGILFTNFFAQASIWEPNLLGSLEEESGYHVAWLAPRDDIFAPSISELSLDEYDLLETPGFMPKNDAVNRSDLKWLERPPIDKPWVLFMPLMFPHYPFQVEEPYFNWSSKKAEEKDLWDSTITMFFTDHGEYLGDHYLIEKWHSGPSDSLTRESLIISGAGLLEGVTFGEMSEMVYLTPTMFQFSSISEQPEHAAMVNKMQEVVMKWIMKMSDFLPFLRDTSFSKVSLGDPNLNGTTEL